MGLQRIGKKIENAEAMISNLQSFTFMAPFYGWGSTSSRQQSHYEETVYFLSLSSQKFLVLISLTSEGWKAEPSLEPPCGFEHGTPGLGIQRLNRRPLRTPLIPDEVLPELFSIKEIASKKLSKVVHVTQAHGSMEAKNIQKNLVY